MRHVRIYRARPSLKGGVVKPIKRIASILLGLLISVASLWLAVRNIKWLETAEAIRSLDLLLLISAIGFLIAGLFLRAERWSVIIARPVARMAVYQATMLGFFFNYVYPARAGDVIKIVGLQRSTGISIGWLGVSGVVDRLADILVLLFSAVLLMKALPSVNLGDNYFYIASAGLLLLVMVGFSPMGDKLLRGLNRWLVFGRRETRRRALLKRALDGLLFFRQNMVHGKRLAKLAGITALVALADYFSIYFLLFAFGWHLPYVAPVAIWVFISAGAALPSAPAGIGVHQLACVMGLKLFGVSSGDAVALSFLLQLGSFIAILLAMLGLLGLRFKKD